MIEEMRIGAKQRARKCHSLKSGRPADATAALLRSASAFDNPRDLRADFDLRGMATGMVGFAEDS